MARADAANELFYSSVRRYDAPFALARFGFERLAELDNFCRRVRGYDLSDVGGLAFIFHYRQRMAFDIFDCIYGVLGAAAYSSHTAVPGHYFRRSKTV